MSCDSFNNIIYRTTKIKALQIFGPSTWCTEKFFGYRVVHHLDTF